MNLKFHYTLLIIFFFGFCSNKKTDTTISDDTLEVSFIQKGVKSPMTIPCWMINSTEFKNSKHHKLINDPKTIDNFKKLYSELSVIKEQSDIDVRIQIVYLHNKKSDTICMGESFNISVNGVVMNEHKEFHNYVKEIINYEYTIRHPITGKMLSKVELQK